MQPSYWKEAVQRKLITIVTLSIAAMAIVAVCVLLYFRAPRTPEAIVHRFVSLWNAGRDEEAIAMMDDRTLVDRPRAHQVLQCLRDNFGKADVHEGEGVETPRDFVGKLWIGSAPRAKRLSIPVTPHRFTIEFDTGDWLLLGVYLVTDEKNRDGRIGFLTFLADDTFDECFESR